MNNYIVVRSDGTSRAFTDSSPAIAFLIESKCYAELFDGNGKKILQKGVPN